MRNTLDGWPGAEDGLGSYVLAFRRFADLKGRSTRPEYWWFAFVNFVILMVLSNVELQLGLMRPGQSLGIFTGLYSAVALMPSIAVGVRRLHDSDTSGWWLLLGFVPLLGDLILLFMLVRAGTSGENRFGPDSRAVVEPSFEGVPEATVKGRFAVCPWCGRTNPRGLRACQWCRKPYSE